MDRNPKEDFQTILKYLGIEEDEERPPGPVADDPSAVTPPGHTGSAAPPNHIEGVVPPDDSADSTTEASTTAFQPAAKTIDFANLPLEQLPWVKVADNGKQYIWTPPLVELIRSPEYEHRIITIARDNAQTLGFCVYDGTRYRILTENQVKAILKKYMPMALRQPQHWEKVLKELLTEMPDIFEASLNSDENLSCFQNGVHRLDTDEVLPHSPEYLLTNQIPCNYIPGLPWSEAPHFKGFLDMLTDGDPDNETLILEYIGAILSNVPGYRFKKLLILYGPGDTGKSVLREFVISLLGKENVQAIDLKRLSGRFGAARLYGKRLAGSGDMSSASIAELDVLKQLTGGDDLYAEDKGKDGFTFKYSGYLWFNSNRLPQFGGDHGAHVYERMMILPCPNIVPPEKRDANLLDKLLAEKEVVVSQAMAHLREAVARGYRFTEGDSVKQSREEYQQQNSSLAKFLNDFCVLNAGKVQRAEFHKIYTRWCKDNQYFVEKTSDVTATLKSLGIEAQKSHGIYYYPIEVHTAEALGPLANLSKAFW